MGVVSFDQSSESKLHTLLDLRGNIPTFIHISDGKMGDVNVLDIMPIEAGAFYVMDRGYLDFSRLYACIRRVHSSSRAPNADMDARRVYSAPTDRSHRHHLRSDASP